MTTSKPDNTAPRKKYALIKWVRRYNKRNPAHAIVVPQGFTPSSKRIGQPARTLLGIMQSRSGLTVTRKFDEKTMLKLFPPGIRGKVMAKAHSQLGVHEWPSGSNSGAVRKYLEAAGYPWAGPWCAAFVTWVLKKCGIKHLPDSPASVDSWMAFARRHDLLKSEEKSLKGDLWIWSFGGDPTAHIGFCDDTKPRDSVAYYLDGNVGDYGGQVTNASRAASQIHACIDLVKLNNLK